MLYSEMMEHLSVLKLRVDEPYREAVQNALYLLDEYRGWKDPKEDPPHREQGTVGVICDAYYDKKGFFQLDEDCNKVYLDKVSSWIAKLPKEMDLRQTSF